MAFQTPSIQSVYQNKQLNSPLSQIILMLIVIVLFSWFLFKPKLTTVIENRKVLTAAKSQLASVDNEKRELNRLVQQLQSASSEVKLTEEALPLSGRTSKPHILLDSLAKSSGMVVVQITPDDTDNIISAGNKAVLADPYKASRALNESMYTVSVTGTIDQFKNYLQLLETNGRVLDVSTLEIVGGDPVTKFRIKIKTYSYEAI
jgi:Tfp pilus assembly protein PilO